jgi:phosphate uptake regulator
VTHVNPRLEERLQRVRDALVALATAVDENLRTVLLLMTTEDDLTPSLSLKPTTALEAALMDRSMALLALEGPVARDLRWAMAMIRVGKDYERVQDLTAALHDRVLSLSETLLDPVLHAMTGVTQAILRLHGIVLEVWRQRPEHEDVPTARLDEAKVRVGDALAEVERLAVEAMVQGDGTPEDMRELVLATRHLHRITEQIHGMPRELAAARRFGA